MHADLKEEEMRDVQGTFALRATLGTCLAKLKALDRTALAMFPLLFHSCTAPLGGDGDEDLYSAAQPTTGSVSYTHLTLPTSPYV